MTIEDRDDLDRIDFDKGDGLVPLIAQHVDTGEVLMLGVADRDALERTLEDRRVTFWSRSKERLWQKGESSGNALRLVALHADCDADAVLAQVVPQGPTCHTGDRSCFDTAPILSRLADTIERRAGEPTSRSYTARLLDDRNLRLKKLAEEAGELALACTDAEARRRSSAGADAGAEADVTGRVAEEAADLVYHLLVACRAVGVDLPTILAELRRRRED